MMRVQKGIKIQFFLGFIVLTGSIIFATRQLVLADSVTTQVSVSNSAPVFIVDPTELPASNGSSPVNVGSGITFTATATDSNNDSYRLAICKANGITPNGTSLPTCSGGAWCISNATATGGQSSCSYTTQVGDAEINAWYAFVCDSIVGSSCSISSQGGGVGGSPFEVNHPPSFTQILSTSGDPGASIQFSATAIDSDISLTPDTVTLIVCNSVGATVAGCTLPANQLCVSSGIAQNPTCSYTLPAVIPQGNHSFYAYLFDSHGLASTNSPFPSSNYVVNNIAPVVSNVVINGGTDISLTAGSTTTVGITGSVSDSNSCQQIGAVSTNVYRSGITGTLCDELSEQDANRCYFAVSCSVSGDTCAGNSDASADYACSVTMQYHADATDAGSQYSAENWFATIRAIDTGSSSGISETGIGVELLSLTGMSIGASINYGNIAQGSDTGATNSQVTVSAIGNVGLDVEVSGTDMSNGTDNIPVANQKYALAPFTYLTGGTSLTTSPVEVEINVLKPTTTITPSQKLLYWGIGIPISVGSGNYTGNNSITGIKGEVEEW